jgi:hypothetical protein
MSHVLFLREVLSVDSGINTDNFSFVVYVIRFLVTQNMTLNDSQYHERATEGIGYVVSYDDVWKDGGTD